MKVFTVPTATSALAAALSVLFFTGLSRVIGDALLGQVIFVQAVTAVVLIVCVPQCWIYLIAAQSREELARRYRQGLTIELTCIALGALAVVGISMSPMAEGWDGMLYIYASLAIQASSSCLGWLRATENWRGYALWVVGSNLIRVPLVWTTPWLVAWGVLPEVRGEQALVMAVYFLIPDSVRLVAVAIPIAIRHYRWPGISESLAAIRSVLKNWTFDVGSSLTETADKVVVGALLGPYTLVAYFFARRLSVVATMVCDPFYMEQFRRMTAPSRITIRRPEHLSVYAQGLGLAIVMFVIVMGALVPATLVPALEARMPNAVLTQLPMFSTVLFFDCLMAANRWSRFAVLLNGGSLRLLAVRLSLFSLFAVNTWLLGHTLAGMGLAVAFGLLWLLEAIYVGYQSQPLDDRGVLTKCETTSTRKSIG